MGFEIETPEEITIQEPVGSARGIIIRKKKPPGKREPL